MDGKFYHKKNQRLYTALDRYEKLGSNWVDCYQ